MPVPDMSVWQGRDDTVLEGHLAKRWHQCVVPWSAASPPGITLVGFACDEGVRRNQGRLGAIAGPASLRRGLANLAWSNLRAGNQVFDAGDVICGDTRLEQTQIELSDSVATLIQQFQKVIVLGGGHETAWGTFLGLTRTFPHAALGIINLDAHFDLRHSPVAHSGTPFAQMAMWCSENIRPFHYYCLGIAEPANSSALFLSAQTLAVTHKFDHELTLSNLDTVRKELHAFMAGVDYVYLSLDLDVLPGWVMPAVSAPAARGVSLEVIEAVLQWVAATEKLAAADVVEFNPTYDRDGIAARVAARLVWQLARHWSDVPHVLR